MIACPVCGTQNPPGSAFCDQCGAKLGAAPAPMPVPPAAGPMPAAAGTTCPACGQPYVPGEAFCGECGAQLPPAGAPLAGPAVPPGGFAPGPVPGPAAPGGFVPGPVVQPPAPAPAFGRPRLVITETGTELPLSGKTEYLIGRQDPVSGIFPEADLDPFGAADDGVSRRHARLTTSGGQWFITDLSSVNGTFVNNGPKLAANTPQPLNNGDRIRLGRMELTFYLT
jgi:predicted nucleic acid-binding Zn ribbon protein